MNMDLFFQRFGAVDENDCVVNEEEDNDRNDGDEEIVDVLNEEENGDRNDGDEEIVDVLNEEEDDEFTCELVKPSFFGIPS